MMGTALQDSLSVATPRRRAPDGDIPTLDWEGRPLDCSACDYQALRGLPDPQGCEPGHSCVQDAYARRIDRFFRNHRELAREQLRHPYFEVRAIAARYADPFQLPALLHDPDETVRLQVALRVPQRLLREMVSDPHREVRIRVAQRIDVDQLSRMVQDPDYEVRATVARRLTPALLPLLANDPDVQVRCAVARRLEMPALWRLVSDPAPEVRCLVAERLPAPLLAPLLRDSEWRVRWEAAGRAAADLAPLLRECLDDKDAEVRLRALERLTELDLTPCDPVATPEVTHGRQIGRAHV
jgi:hypothetical protein